MTAAWRPGAPLPDNELWTWPMVEQFTKRSRRTWQRRGLPCIEPGLFEPATVRAFCTTATACRLRPNPLTPRDR